MASHKAKPGATRIEPCQLGVVATHKRLEASGRSRAAAGDVLSVCTGSFPHFLVGCWTADG
jgi:hypothetical protein